MGTIFIAIDECTVENGCLQVGHVRSILSFFTNISLQVIVMYDINTKLCYIENSLTTWIIYIYWHCRLLRRKGFLTFKTGPRAQYWWFECMVYYGCFRAMPHRRDNHRILKKDYLLYYKVQHFHPPLRLRVPFVL